MKGRTIVIAALVAVTVFSVAGVALASPWMTRIGGAWPGGLGGLRKAIKDGTTFTPPAKVLGLTDEQAAQIQEIQSRATAEIQAISVDLLAKQAELRSLLWQKDPDQSVLTAKFEEITALNQQIADVAAKAREDFLAVLTPEQQAKYNETPGLGRGFRCKAGRFGKPTSPNVGRGAKFSVKGL